MDWKPKTISKDGSTTPKKLGRFDQFVTDVVDAPGNLGNLALKGLDVIGGGLISGYKAIAGDVPEFIRKDVFEKIRPVSYPRNPIQIIQEYTRSDKAPAERDPEGDYSLSEEPWRMALHLPTKGKYFKKATVNPGNNPNRVAYSISDDVIDKNKLIKLAKDDAFWKKNAQKNPSGEEFIPAQGMYDYLTESFKKKNKLTGDAGYENFNQIDPLANFQIYRGVDPKTKKKYVSIYDKYDLDSKTLDAFINPFEIYNRYNFENGGQLEKLDQLTNFTNYNTKQPGGWLDKYEG